VRIHKVKNKTRLIAALPLAVVFVLLIACGNVGSSGGSGPSGGGSGPTIAVGSKDFTEQFILGNMYALALENAGFNVERKLNLGSEQIADKALQSGQIDLYPEYTGTALAAILPYNQDPANLNSPQATYQQAKELYAKRDPADTMLQPAPFNNTYGIFVRSEVAQQKHLSTLADLAEASPDLTFVSFSQFQNRSDGYPNMQKNYPAFNFKDTIIVNDLGLRYEGLQNGKGDVGVGFTTDGQLTSNQLVVMKDKKNIFPQYYVAPVVRSDTLKKYPRIKGILDKVTASLDVKTMRELNAKVDLQHEDPADVANAYLKSKGLMD
jgi:osmoprotectant transport system substrate-binding protein